MLINVGHGKRLITVMSNVGQGKFYRLKLFCLILGKIFLLDPWTLLHHFECIHNLSYLLIVIKNRTKCCLNNIH